VGETVFAELRRYVGFDAVDEAALRWLAPAAAPSFAAIAASFYRTLREHEDAHRVFADDAQIKRLEQTLQVWMRLLLNGPWDEAYYAQRSRIGQTHVRIGLPQRYMFTGMNVLRRALLAVAETAPGTDAQHRQAATAIDKLLDLELAIMLESYHQAFVTRLQAFERAEKDVLVERLELSEARYQEIVEAGEALISTWEPGGPIVLFNRRCEDLIGISRADARGRTWAELFGVDPTSAADRERVLLAGGRVAAIDAPVRDPSGREHRIRWHHTILREPDRHSVCAIGLDVTEEYQLAARTRRAERLASLGTMAAGLAHEVRNPLNAAHLQLTLVDRRLSRVQPDVAGAREAAGLAATEVKRLAGLVGEFLEFARPQPLRTARGDLRSTIDVIAALMRPEAAAAGIGLEIDVGDVPVYAEYDDEKIKQVLLNLVRNAIEAAGPGTRVEIRTRVRDAVVIEVEDQGRGLPGPNAPVFEPFFTTKETGTGLGLAIVHRIVMDHGGVVDVESQPGRTVFSVSLPRVERAVSADASA